MRGCLSFSGLLICLQKMLDGDGSSEGYSPTNQEPQPDTASRRQSVKSEDILDQFDMAEAVRVRWFI